MEPASGPGTLSAVIVEVGKNGLATAMMPVQLTHR